MWQEARIHGSNNWQWIQRNDTYSPSGSTKTGRTVYSNLRIWVTDTNLMKVSRSKGTIMNQYKYALIDKFQLIQDPDIAYDEVTPQVNRTFLKKDGVMYKVIGILDLTEDPNYFCYYFTLKREEIR